MRTLFDDSESKKVFRLSDYNSHFGDPNSGAQKLFEVTLKDGRVFFFAEDEECILPVGEPKVDNVAHLRWQTFGEENVMTEKEVLQVLTEAGIEYDHRYRVCNQNPVEAINKYCRANGKVFRCPWYNYVDHDDWQWRKLYWARPRQINPDCTADQWHLSPWDCRFSQLNQQRCLLFAGCVFPCILNQQKRGLPEHVSAIIYLTKEVGRPHQ